MVTTAIDPDGSLTVDGLTLRAPGVRGEVSVERVARPGRVPAGGAAAGTAPDPLDRALRRQRMRTYRTVAIQGTRPAPAAAAARPPRRRADRGPRPEPLSLTVPAPRAGRGQVVLVVDNGVATWHFSEESRSAGLAASASPTRTYVIPQVPPSPERLAGAALSIGSLVIKVITFPVAKLVGMAARRLARDWDAGQHPSQVRAYGPDGTLTDLTPADWDRLATGPAVLFVHGTFSSTEGAFGRLPSATMTELHGRYGGRVIAFDHPTLADDPFVNARAFFDIVADRALDMDIVCHSRGGLVARSITERPGDLAPLGAHVRVRQIAMVGVLNAGTILADAAHWSELLDRYTTLLRLLPSPGIIDTLETVLAVVKAMAVEVAQDLEGIAAMAPGSEFLGHLNVGPAPADPPGYRVIGSDFEPIDPDLKAWLNDEVRDRIFAEHPNDMMVTIESMTGANGSGRFPIAAADIHAFAAAQAVEHADYFGQPSTSEWLLGWLTG